ncbi:Tripartite tricarboxylate transporter TctB family protein [compost metagenome]
MVFLDAYGLATPYSKSDPVGPKTVPFIVAALLIVCAVLLAVNVMRGGKGEAEGGEDVDLAHPADWKTVLPLVGAFIANILLIDWAGWVISGTILFWGSVWALGGRNYVRDGLISLAMSILTFYGFYLGLGIALPAGLLEGIL